MKRHWKKAASLILSVCLLFSMVPPYAAAAAASVTTYDLNLVENGLVKSAATIDTAKTIIENRYETALWKWEASSETSIKFYNGGMTAMGNASNWMAIRIQSPGTGLYTLGLDYAASPHNGTVAVYVLPGTVTDIAAALKPENRVGKLNIWEENQSGVADYKTNYTACDGYVGTCQLTADEEYVVVFEAVEPSPYYASRSYMCFSKLTLTQGDVFAEQELDPIVSSVVAAPGPVTLLEGCFYGTTVQVNGKDYLFEPVEGGKLLAFDMDSFTRKYEVDLPFLTARGITADNSGNLWFCGDSKVLYRYDPVTHIGETLKSFEDVDPGVTTGFDMVYADGCVYFGTNPTGSIIKYDIDADTYERLYTNGGSYTNSLVYKDGYLYATVYDVRDKAQENWKAIRINLADTSDVVQVDISHKMPAGQMIFDAGLAGDLLLIGGGQYQTEFVAIDINTMQLVDLGISGGIFCSVTEEVDGKVYFVLNNGPQGAGLYALDVQSRTLTSRLISTNRGLRCADHSIIQVEDENYPGNNIAVYATATGEPMLYNLELNKIKRGLELIENYGTATHIRSLTNGAAGSGDIYIGAFNVSNCAAYNTGSNTFTKFATSGQTDAMCYYEGKLYAGNYPDGTIVQVDLEDSKNNKVLLKLNDDVYDQARIHTLTAGDGKLFAGSTPDKGLYGGCLAWVDLETGETYVERNVVQDQTVNCIVYHDGLIYGTTSIYGGTSTTKRSDLSAKLFVYDVAAKQKLAEFDLREYLSGFTGNIDYISGIAADPDVAENDRFWGLVSETLFTFTYDKQAEVLTVTEELSYKKDSYETGGGRTWFPKPFCFDGKGNLYLSFEANGGTRRINVNDTSDNTRLTMPNVLYYTLGEDGNLYYGISETLYAYPLEVSAADWEAPAALDQQIRAIGTPVTLEDAPAIREACAAYDKLDLAHKALVQYADALKSAEAELLDLQIQALAQTAAHTYKTQVLALYEQYGSLTDAQKRAVKNSPALFTAYDAVNDKCYAADGAFFTTFAQAMEKALLSDSKTVTLIDNATEDEVLLTGGVTLDLGGHTLQAEAFRANLDDVAQGYVVDSSDGNTGLLKTEKGEDLFLSNNPDLPMYDAAAGGYRLFDYTLELHSSTETVDEGKQKFWFKFHFLTNDGSTQLDQDAYDLVAAGGSDFGISVRLNWKGTQLPQAHFGRNGSVDAFSKEWATGATANRWLYVVVGGLDKVSAGTLTVQPVLTAGNVEVTGGVITYEKKIGGAGGWSDEGPTM